MLLVRFTTEQMKRKWKVPKGRALSDFAASMIILKADFKTLLQRLLFLMQRLIK